MCCSYETERRYLVLAAGRALLLDSGTLMYNTGILFEYGEFIRDLNKGG